MASSDPDDLRGELPDELEDALADALLRAPAERQARLAALIDSNPEAASELRARLSTIGADVVEEPAALGCIGGYTLLKILGQGGMGTVYAAEQHEPVSRTVAIKLIRGGSREMLARFDLERQALAAMEHPNIASIFDAGVSGEGQPFFVMEYVAGRPLTDHCDAERLSLEARIALFQQVCRGVQHAHRRGVLHRDLKPGNILVAEDEGRSMVKIIDFGLARAVDDRMAPDAAHTMQGQLLGTPEYMSPEQAAGDIARIDTRSDVFALGVVLYELLTGELPVDSDTLREGGVADVRRRLLETEPPKPSTRVAATTVRDGVAQARCTTSGSLQRRLRGDLDWVVMRAMAREPERRYESPAELAADLDRYLSDEPVDAGPPDATYRLRKFLRRHRGRVLAAALLLLSLVAGLIGTTMGLGEAREQQARAEGALRSIHEISQWFVVDLHDQLADVPGTMAARRQLVDKGLRYLEELVQQRADDAALQFDVARGYLRIGSIQGWPHASHLGDADGALASFERAREVAQQLERKHTGEFPVVNLQIDCRLRAADVHVAAMRLEEALAELAAADERLAELPVGSVRRQREFDATLRHAGVLMRQGKTEAALEQFAAAEQLLPEGPLTDAEDRAVEAVASLFQQLGGIHSSEFLPGAVWDPARALACFERAREAYAVLAERHPGRSSAQRLLITTQLGIAAVHRRQKSAPAAVRAYKQVIMAIEAVQAQDPNSVMALDLLQTACEGLGRMQRDQGELDEAVAAFEQAARAYERKLALVPDDLRERNLQATMLELLAGVHARRGDVASLRKVFRDSIAARTVVDQQRSLAVDDALSPIVAWGRFLKLLTQFEAYRDLVEERRALDADYALRIKRDDNEELRGLARRNRVSLAATQLGIVERDRTVPDARVRVDEAVRLLRGAESDEREHGDVARADSLARLLERAVALLAAVAR